VLECGSVNLRAIFLCALSFAEAVEVLGGADEELVAGSGWRRECVGVVEGVYAEKFEGRASLDHGDIGGFTDEIEFTVG